MTKPNIMKYFISGEGGTSCLLATLFDPELEQPIQAKFRLIFCERLKAEGISLSVEGPQVVKQECMDMDIVMIWDDWIIVLENKIAAASITRYQLQRYYNLIVGKISRGDFLGVQQAQSKRICVIYLTPTQDTGVAEFNSLHVNRERQDVKIHLSWEVLLHEVEGIFPKEPVTDPYLKLVQDGLSLTSQLLEANKERGPKIEETEKRIEMKNFIVEVDQLVRAMMHLEPNLQLNLWRDNNGDQLYGNLNGKTANVYFDLLENGTSITKQGTSTMFARFSGKVANKAPSAYKKQFNEFPAWHWSAMLALGADVLIVDTQKHKAHVEVSWSGQYSPLVRDAAALFCRFLTTFRPFMIDIDISNTK